LEKLRTIDRVVSRIERLFVITFLGMMVGFSFLQVLLRTLLTHGNLHWVNTLMSHMDWMEPLSRLLVLWLTFLGASLVTGENRHIKIDIMSALLPAKWSPYRGFVLSLACTIIMALMLRSSIGYLRSEMEFGTEMFLSIPTWVGQLILPLGFSLLLFRFFIQGLEQIVTLFRGPHP